MASVKGKQWRALIALALLIGSLWGVIVFQGWKPRLGLDLQGGISVILQPVAGQDVDEGSLEKAVDIIQNRVDGLGVAEPDIALQGGNISVQLPGLKNPSEALRVIGTTAKLSFRPVVEVLGPRASISEDKAKGLDLPVCGEPDTHSPDDPTTDVVYCERLQDENGKDLPITEWPLIRLGPTVLQGDDVATAGIELQDPTTGSGFAVKLNFTRAGAKKFATVTEQLVGKQLAIVLDQVIESAPNVNEKISGGNARITGSFTEKEAKELALILRYGALPVELEPSSTTTISPTLGKESLQNGLLAGFIGLGVVFLYVLFFYRALGGLIWIGIGIHAALTIGVIILLGEAAGFALTLAGIAGLIVSLGIASDSFIVYFERIKDEVAAGKTVRSAVERAWPSAWRTIFAADLVTALAAIVLYFLAVGSVRGFALTLGLSTALDLFVSRLFMHPSVVLLSGTRLLGSSKTLGYGARSGPAKSLRPAGGEA